MAMHCAFPYIDILRYGGRLPGQPEGTAEFCCSDADTIMVFRAEVVDEAAKQPEKEAAPVKNYVITEDCIGCAMCLTVCPAFCINGKHIPFEIEQESCIRCGSCMDACPGAAIVLL